MAESTDQGTGSLTRQNNAIEIAVLKNKFIIYYNFRHTFVRCCARVACPSPIPGATPLQVPAATHDDGRRLADEIYLSCVAYTVPAYVDY